MNTTFKMWHGLEGLEVYEQVHQNDINRFLHLAFLPAVFYGIFRSVPHSVIPFILFSYTGYYAAVIDIKSAVNNLFLIGPWAVLANNQTPSLKVGLLSLTCSLVIQEVIGHSLFEEINSRLTLSFVLNAIMYSPLFYSMHVGPILLMVHWLIAQSIGPEF